MVFPASIDCIHSYTFRNTIRSYWPLNAETHRSVPIRIKCQLSLVVSGHPHGGCVWHAVPTNQEPWVPCSWERQLRESRKERSSRHRLSKSSSLLASRSRSSSTASQFNVLLPPSSPSLMLSEQFLTTGYEQSCRIARTFMRLHIQRLQQIASVTKCKITALRVMR